MVSILVFVELALDDKAYVFYPCDSSCFNPCFRGTCSWWMETSTQEVPKASVSILVFVELALDGRIWASLANNEYVSILVFVELALDERLPRMALWSGMGFNPCFRGTCSWWEGRRAECAHGCRVSILVFVELALDEIFQWGTQTMAWHVSILVFVELALDESMDR